MFSYEYHNLDSQVIMSLLCLPLVSYKECQGKLKLVVYKKAGKIGLVFCNALRRSELSKYPNKIYLFAFLTSFCKSSKACRVLETYKHRYFHHIKQ